MPLGEVFLPVLPFSPVYSFPRMLQTHLHPHVALTGKTNGRNLEIVQEAVLSGNREVLDRQEEEAGIYIWKVVADLPSYTASHPECREFHAPSSVNSRPHKRSLIATGIACPRRVSRC